MAYPVNGSGRNFYDFPSAQANVAFSSSPPNPKHPDSDVNGSGFDSIHMTSHAINGVGHSTLSGSAHQQSTSSEAQLDLLFDHLWQETCQRSSHHNGTTEVQFFQSPNRKNPSPVPSHDDFDTDFDTCFEGFELEGDPFSFRSSLSSQQKSDSCSNANPNASVSHLNHANKAAPAVHIPDAVPFEPARPNDRQPETNQSVELLNEIAHVAAIQLSHLEAALQESQKIMKEHQAQLARMGNNEYLNSAIAKEKMLQGAMAEKRQILKNPKFAAYYYAFHTRFTSVLSACTDLTSGMMGSAKKSLVTPNIDRAEDVSSAIGKLIDKLPFGSLLRSFIEGPLNLYGNRERAIAVQKGVQFFQGPIDRENFAEVMARQLTLAQAQKINDLSLTPPKLKQMGQKISGKTSNPIEEFAQKDCNTLLRQIMHGDLKPHPTIEDIPLFAERLIGPISRRCVLFPLPASIGNDMEGIPSPRRAPQEKYESKKNVLHDSEQEPGAPQQNLSPKNPQKLEQIPKEIERVEEEPGAAPVSKINGVSGSGIGRQVGQPQPAPQPSRKPGHTESISQKPNSHFNSMSVPANTNATSSDKKPSKRITMHNCGVVYLKGQAFEMIIEVEHEGPIPNPKEIEASAKRAMIELLKSQQVQNLDLDDLVNGIDFNTNGYTLPGGITRGFREQSKVAFDALNIVSVEDRAILIEHYYQRIVSGKTTLETLLRNQPPRAHRLLLKEWKEDYEEYREQVKQKSIFSRGFFGPKSFEKWLKEKYKLSVKLKK